jgi:hypothetical protein
MTQAPPLNQKAQSAEFGGGGGRAGARQPLPRLMVAFLVLSNRSSVALWVISTKITVVEFQ